MVSTLKANSQVRSFYKHKLHTPIPQPLPLRRDEAVKQTICLLVLLAPINQKSVDMADLGQIPRPVNWFSGEQQSNYST